MKLKLWAGYLETITPTARKTRQLKRSGLWGQNEAAVQVKHAEKNNSQIKIQQQKKIKQKQKQKTEKSEEIRRENIAKSSQSSLRGITFNIYCTIKEDDSGLPDGLAINQKAPATHRSAVAAIVVLILTTMDPLEIQLLSKLNVCVRHRGRQKKYVSVRLCALGLKRLSCQGTLSTFQNQSFSQGKMLNICLIRFPLLKMREFEFHITVNWITLDMIVGRTKLIIWRCHLVVKLWLFSDIFHTRRSIAH